LVAATPRLKPTTSILAGDGPQSVALADVNAHGTLDVVTANHFSGDIGVPLNSGIKGLVGLAAPTTFSTAVLRCEPTLKKSQIPNKKPALGSFPNVYAGHTQGTEPALGAGSNVSLGAEQWERGTTEAVQGAQGSLLTLISDIMFSSLSRTIHCGIDQTRRSRPSFAARFHLAPLVRSAVLGGLILHY
jgi:hypothetical protein